MIEINAILVESRLTLNSSPGGKENLTGKDWLNLNTKQQLPHLSGRGDKG